MTSFLNGRIAVEPTDAQRMRIAQSLQESHSYEEGVLGDSIPLRAWVKHIFCMDDIPVITACCDYIHWRYYGSVEAEGMSDDVYAIFELSGLCWNVCLSPYSEHTPFMEALTVGPWYQVYSILKLMRQSNSPFQTEWIPTLFQYREGALEAWRMVVDLLDRNTLNRAMRYLWGSFYVGTCRIRWTQIWLDRCKATYGTACDVLEPIVGQWTALDCCRAAVHRNPHRDAQTDLERIVKTLGEIKEIRKERRTRIGVVLMNMFDGQRHTELFQLVSDFDVGSSSAYDTWVCPDLSVPFYHNVDVPSFVW